MWTISGTALDSPSPEIVQLGGLELQDINSLAMPARYKPHQATCKDGIRTTPGLELCPKLVWPSLLKNLNVFK